MRIKNWGLFLIMTIGWGFSYISNKIGLEYCSPILFGTLSTFIGCSVIAIFLYARGVHFLKDRKMWMVFGPMGLLATTSFVVTRSIGLDLCNPGIITVMIYTHPMIVVPLGAIFLKERITLLRALGVFLGFIGIVLLSLNDFTGQLGLSGGELFGLAAAMSWAGTTIWYKKISPPTNPIVGATIQMAVGSFGLLLVLEMFETPRFDLNISLILSLAYTSIIGFGIGSVIWFYLLKGEEAISLSAYLFIVPFISLFFSYMFFNEELGLISLTGCGLILFGIYLVHKGEYPSLRLQKNIDEFFRYRK